MLPVVEPDGVSTMSQIRWTSFLLIPISLLPTVVGISGMLYLIGALVAGVLLLKISYTFSFSKSHTDAKKLLKATVFYLPVLLFLIVFDVTF